MTRRFSQFRLKVSIFRGVKNVLVKSRMVPLLKRLSWLNGVARCVIGGSNINLMMV